MSNRYENNAHGAVVWFRDKTLASQLASAGFQLQKNQSLASIERVVKLISQHKAQLWIGHDKDITAKINRAPKFYE